MALPGVLAVSGKSVAMQRSSRRQKIAGVELILIAPESSDLIPTDSLRLAVQR